MMGSCDVVVADISPRLPFLYASSGRGGVGLDRDPVGDQVQPSPQVAATPEGAGLLDQDQEGRLKRILRVARVTQDGPAHPEDHRPVAGHQRLECRPVACRQEPVDQPVVGEARERSLDEELIEIAQRRPQCLDSHSPASFSRDRPLPSIRAEQGPTGQLSASRR